jgi:hypothetical protein
MSQSSFRLGVIFLGIGIILFGRYLQEHVEGFQETISSTPTGSESGSTMPIGSITANLPNTTTSSDSINRSLTTDITDKYFLPATTTNYTGMKELDLVSIDFEIQKKFNIVHNTKDATDKVLVKYISDADLFMKLDSLYTEVKIYVIYMTGIMGIQTVIEESTPESLLNLRQLIYTANEYVNILYKIYITFPSTIISSNTFITSSSGIESITDDVVLANTVTMIRQELQNIPSLQSMIAKIKTTLLASAVDLKNTPTSSSISFYETFMTYMRVNNIEYTGLKNYLEKIKATKMKNMILIAQNNIIAYLQENIATINAVLQNVKNLPNLEESSQSTIQIRLSTYNDLLKTAEEDYTKFEAIEPFESYKNPYSPPTIALEQTKEFRLHGRSKEYFQSYKNPYKPQRTGLRN